MFINKIKSQTKRGRRRQIKENEQKEENEEEEEKKKRKEDSRVWLESFLLRLYMIDEPCLLLK